MVMLSSPLNLKKKFVVASYNLDAIELWSRTVLNHIIAGIHIIRKVLIAKQI